MDELADLRPPPALPAILARTEALGVPMPSEPRTGALLRVLAASKPSGFYVIGDMLPQSSWPEGHAPRVPRLIADLAARENLRMVSTAWSSGLVVAVRSLRHRVATRRSGDDGSAPPARKPAGRCCHGV
jgi:hypothetical protein